MANPRLGKPVLPSDTFVSAPLLLECDVKGQIVWLADRARVSLCEAMARRDPALVLDGFRFTRVWSTPDRLLMSGEFTCSATEASGAALLDVQSNLLRHFFQLERAERRLSRHARSLRRGRSNTVRHLELERQRLGRELHTGVGQLLAAIQMQLEVINVQLTDPPSQVEYALARISTLAADALEQVRSVSHRLHPPEWQRLTLEAALRQLWEASGIPQRFEATLVTATLSREPDFEIKVLFYRAAQEALANFIRHARATRISLLLEPRDSHIVLSIRDNGVGFDVAALIAAPASLTAGIGLRSIREQAASVGASLEIASGPEGTALQVVAPYSPPETLGLR